MKKKGEFRVPRKVKKKIKKDMWLYTLWMKSIKHI